MICPRCLKESPAEVHTCTPTDFVRDLEKQLAECQRDRKELVAALKRLWIACPTGLECNSFHHAKQDQHGYAEECKPAAEYLAAIEQANAALAKLGADKTGEGS